MTATVSTLSEISALAGPEPDRGSPGTPMQFSGRAREFLKILVTGSLLLIPTLGFYRFWLNTRLRRHLWAHTRIGGEAFEYTGTGRELLIGFLIAVAISVPVYIAYTIIGLIAEEAQAFASVPFGAFFLLLGQFAAYRARRYRATRTLFRGLRFWMTGSGWSYAFRAAGWFLVIALTLGLALPWAYASLERYMMRHTHYGTLRGDFVGTGGEFFRRGWWLWVLAVPVPALVLAATAWVFDGSREERSVAVAIATFPVMLMLGLVLPYFGAVYARWRASGLRFGPVAVHSNLRPGAFLGTYIKLCLSWVAAGATISVVLGTLFAATQAAGAGRGQAPPTGFIVGSAVTFLIFSLSLGIVGRYFMQRGLWAILVGSLTVSNLAALDEVAAAGQASDSVGEGLLDAFDSF